MILLAILLAASSHIVIDDTIEVPRAEWRYVDIAAKEPKAVVTCEFEEVSSNTEVRVVWIARKDLTLYRPGEQRHILAASPFGREGRLRHFAPEAGDYAMVIENLPTSRSAAKVKMKVWLQSPITPTYASPERRVAVILVSGLLFVGMISFSAYKLRRPAASE